MGSWAQRFVPGSVGSFAPDVDALIVLVTLFIGIWFLAAEGVFFWFIFRFRAREGTAGQYISGKDKNHKRWITIPHYLVLVCDIVIIIAAIQVWVKIKQSLPPADAQVRVIGQQWAWTFVHPGADGKLDTADDITTTDELHVEVDKTYHFLLESKDVLHSFSVPVFRLKQDAIPGRTIIGWFQARQTGQHDIQCAEMCGIGHGVMAARIFIESPQQHATWVRERTTTPAVELAGAGSAGAEAAPAAH
jgi:cytochrome c oxidase subunit 2